MHGLAIALHLAGLVAALAIAIAGGFLVAVLTHARRVLQIAVTAVMVPAILALPIWSLVLAVGGLGGTAIWIIPSIYLALLVPLVKLLVSATGAASQP